MRNKIVSTITYILVVTLILSSCFFFSRAEDNTIQNKLNTLSLEEQKEQVEQEIQKSQEQLTYVEGILSEAVINIQELDDKINEYQTKLNEVNIQYKELQAKVEKSENELENASNDYQKKYNLLQERLVAIYKNGETTYLDVLLNSKNIIEFISKYYIVQKIAKYDSKIIDDLKIKKQEIEKINNQLQEDKAKMKLTKVEAEKQTVVLANTKTVYENYKNSLSESEKLINSQIESYKKQQQELENLIQFEINNSIYELQYSGGIMIWPTVDTAYITSNYGTRVHPIQGIVKNHDGIDIGGKTGDAIYAAADGVIIYSEFNYGGYGNMVMIDHGLDSNGVKIVTLYAHGDKLLKSVGDIVKKGDTIMEMGSTGNSTGPHLHFEVRENGLHVDPKKYLSGE